jgi:hypothetical protein
MLLTFDAVAGFCGGPAGRDTKAGLLPERPGPWTDCKYYVRIVVGPAL